MKFGHLVNNKNSIYQLNRQTYHFQNSQSTGDNSYNEVEGRLKPLVLFVEQLLVHDAQEGQGPDAPPQVVGKAIVWQGAETQPRCVRSCDEEVDHSSVATVKKLVKYSAKFFNTMGIQIPG